ncbi:hypothetical protein V8F33_003052 [Rhypophila sp. PSN 637]
MHAVPARRAVALFILAPGRQGAIRPPHSRRSDSGPLLPSSHFPRNTISDPREAKVGQTALTFSGESSTTTETVLVRALIVALYHQLASRHKVTYRTRHTTKSHRT